MSSGFGLQSVVFPEHFCVCCVVWICSTFLYGVVLSELVFSKCCAYVCEINSRCFLNSIVLSVFLICSALESQGPCRTPVINVTDLLQSLSVMYAEAFCYCDILACYAVLMSFCISFYYRAGTESEISIWMLDCHLILLRHLLSLMRTDYNHTSADADAPGILNHMSHDPDMGQ